MSTDAPALNPLIPLNASTLAPKPATPAIDPKIQKVAHDFEQMVIGQLLGPMFEGIDSNGPFGGGSSEAMFRPMLIDEYAKTMAKAGGLGIADSVAREMMKLQHLAAPPQSEATSADKKSGDDDAAGR